MSDETTTNAVVQKSPHCGLLLLVDGYCAGLAPFWRSKREVSM